MTELWVKDCPGVVEAECANGEICVTCYEREQETESPRVQEGLLHLWRFEEGGASQVADWKGGVHLAFNGSGDAQWIDGGGLRILEAASLTGSLDALATNGGLTLEAWIKPAQNQWGRVFSWSQDTSNVNLELRQHSTDWMMRCRGELNGAPSLLTTGGLAAQQLTHFVWTQDIATQREALYLNAWQALGGDRALADLGAFPLTVGNIPEGGRAWLGELHLLALYDWALPEVGIQQNYEAGPHPERVPATPPQEEPISLDDALRMGAWRRTGIPRNDDAALLKYARVGMLGAPMTREFSFEFDGVEYIGQGFAGAIAYVRHGDWGNVRELGW